MMIIVECYRDKALVHSIGFSGDLVRHEFGKLRVLGRVEEAQKAVIGIIDEDPRTGKPRRMEEYAPQNGSTKAIRLLKRKDDETKRLIEISPHLEDWLYVVARRNRISPKEFNLPEDPEVLRNLPLRKDVDFRRFLSALNRTKDGEYSKGG